MMGDGNASIPTPQPVVARPMFGVRRRAAHVRGPFRQSCRSGERRPRRSRAAGGGGGRTAASLTKADLVLNDAVPKIDEPEKPTRCGRTACCSP